MRREVEGLLAFEASARSIHGDARARMPSRLGPYEILSILGHRRHGRGLPRARHRLERDVALKVLPRSLAADPERLARFSARRRCSRR